METLHPLVHETEPVNLEWPVPHRGEWLTPAARFFERNHFRRPDPSPKPPTLAVEGAVRRSLSLGLHDLRHMGALSRWVTIECSGNRRSLFVPPAEGTPWRDGAVGNAEWIGVPLRTVLLRAGLAEGAAWVRFTGADEGRHKETGQRVHFERALPVNYALNPDVLLAWAMNGEPLPHKHGGPLRLIVPGWYGMASVKWLTRVEVRTQPFRGPFQVRDYVYLPAPGAYDRATPVTLGRVSSIITHPSTGAAVPPGNLLVSGLAWSGEAPVARVEVSADQGAHWQPAELLEPAARYAWRRWECLLTGLTPGNVEILARATDAAGRTQPRQAEWNAKGYGNNQMPQVPLTVTRRPAPAPSRPTRAPLR
ncbi:MAG TPA: sulfite oxidase [Symbiobacteriaceae bacterium]|nr:sulfite oxidase [Symbiobacteriaceae bacterium]